MSDTQDAPGGTDSCETTVCNLTVPDHNLNAMTFPVGKITLTLINYSFPRVYAHILMMCQFSQYAASAHKNKISHPSEGMQAKSGGSLKMVLMLLEILLSFISAFKC